MRSALGILVGSLVYAVAQAVFFTVSGYDPVRPTSAGFVTIAIAFGALMAVVAGFVAGWVAGTSPFGHAFAVAFIIAIGAAISLIMRPSGGALWPQLSSVLLFAPLALLGGYLRGRITARDRHRTD